MSESRFINELRDKINQQKDILSEIKKLNGLKEVEDKQNILTQIDSLTKNLKEVGDQTSQVLSDLNIEKSFFKRFFGIDRLLNILKKKGGLHTDELEKETLKRLKEKNKIKKSEVKKEDVYGKLANNLFSKVSDKLTNKEFFIKIKEDLIRSNMKNSLQGYISKILLTTLLSTIGGVLIFLFFLFFKIGATMPIISFAKNISSRIGSLIWIVITFPIGGFFISYSYPSLERKSAEVQIDYELPFATINMAAIAGSMINPIKIFRIIINSDEFPNVRREFIKLINEINIYGYDLVSALINTAKTTPSKKMEELLNGLSATINSGGDLTTFFDTRAETLLFDYKLKREKETKASETFMDLYISIVIAAPMILMLLLMMMKISGLGLSLSTSAITLIMVSSVSMINIFFLVFLHLRKKG